MKPIQTISSLLFFLTPPMALAGSGDTASVPDASKSLCGDRLWGDMRGLRRPEETGIDFRLEATNFYHGLLSGDDRLGIANDMESTGKFDLFIDIDGQKAGLWPGLFINIHGEYRYGDTPNQGGVLSPPNAAMLSPSDSGDAFAFTNVTISQAFSESLLLTVGKFNTIDLANKKFYGGRGVETFMNASFVAMPIGGRTFPISALGAVGTYLKDGVPFINVGIMDALSPTTRPGWDELSVDEMTVFADITFQTNFGGLPGTHTLTGVYSTVDAGSLDQSDILNPPNPGGITPNSTTQSWQVNYLWEQSLTHDPNDPSRGWGTFLLLGVSDGDPNPFEYSIAAGLVGKGVCAARPCDNFGLGVFYNGVSGDLKDTLGDVPAPLIPLPLQDEFGAEVFYNFAVTDWFNISADLQVVQPTIRGNDTAVIGGLRTRLTF